MADPKKYISVFNDGTNDLYIKDAEAQQAIADLQQSVTGGMHYIGETSTELTNGATTSTLTPKSEGAMSKTTGFEAGDLVIYGELEFVWNGAKWKEFGSTGSLKSLAFKDASDIETAGSTSSKMVTASVTGVEGSTSVTGVEGSTTIYGCGDNATVHDTPSLSTTDIYGCGTDATVGSASAWNDGTLASMTYDESNEKLTFVAGTKPSLTIAPTTVATKAASATSVGTGIVAGTAVTVATKAASATTVPIAASAATTVPVAAGSATTVATGALANDGAGASVVTAVSTTIQNKPSV